MITLGLDPVGLGVVVQNSDRRRDDLDTARLPSPLDRDSLTCTRLTLHLLEACTDESPVVAAPWRFHHGHLELLHVTGCTYPW